MFNGVSQNFAKMEITVYESNNAQWTNKTLKEINQSPERKLALADALKEGDEAAFRIVMDGDWEDGEAFFNDADVQERIIEGVIKGTQENAHILTRMGRCNILLSEEKGNDLWRNYSTLVLSKVATFVGPLFCVLRFMRGETGIAVAHQLLDDNGPHVLYKKDVWLFIFNNEDLDETGMLHEKVEAKINAIEAKNIVDSDEAELELCTQSAIIRQIVDSDDAESELEKLQRNVANGRPLANYNALNIANSAKKRMKYCDYMCQHYEKKASQAKEKLLSATTEEAKKEAKRKLRSHDLELFSRKLDLYKAVWEFREAVHQLVVSGQVVGL